MTITQNIFLSEGGGSFIALDIYNREFTIEFNLF
jgi:hypothetical protein